MLKRNTSGLQSHARQKRDSALIRTEQAIQKLHKENKSINFGVVAQEAGVSRTWLYNQIEIRERIEELRDKQLVKKTNIQKSTPDNQIESSVSKTNIIIELQQRINKLETENLVLRQHLEVVYGMSNSELVRTVEVLQIEKAELKRQLQELSNNNDATAVSELINRQLHERIYTLESEKAEMLLQHKQVIQQLDKLNSDLNNQENLKLTNQKQTEDIKKLQTALESTKKELTEDRQGLNTTHAKLTSIEEAKKTLKSNNVLDSKVQDKCSELGIKLNKSLIDLIKSKPYEQVINALSVVEERLAVGSKKVRSKSSLFRTALENGWEPNESDVEREAYTIKTNFFEWYDLARNYGIVQQFKEEEEMIIVQDNTGQWIKFEIMSAKWTLDYLRRVAQPK